MTTPKGPVIIDLEEASPAPSVTEAPPVPDAAALPTGEAMQIAARLAARRPSRLARWFWGLLTALLGAVISVAAWDFVTGLLDRAPLLGWAVTAVFAAFLLVLAVIGVREMAAFGRLSRIDDLRRAADDAIAAQDLVVGRRVVARMTRLYAAREETRWGRDRLAEAQSDMFDAPALLDLAEAELLVPLDKMASREVEAAARQVATVTALVPLALADVAAALVANLRMIRRVAEVYGGRSGVLGSWRLTRAVLTHLVATGAVAVGDDMLEPVLGGTILGKLSRRFGEGLVNGALTARVGVAAMEVCRPLPFSERRRPSVRGMVKNALTGLVRLKTR
ncbi:TIGR01620 family protein [Aestuariivita sp.]|jgi:putative membrane protein|uniref:YcjF family protein n=1 Tax=Aestuariivita sp. TaxID=1872407 RepID=UPI00216DDD17|nr:TIGR01620 family protein [Aestuariivita sp.]MCE8007277.1 TIGR01620 family protein [Aestuariivita sp.]